MRESGVLSSARGGFRRAFLSARWAAGTHYATLVVAAAILLWVGQNQWFYNDEWDFLWPDQLIERLIEGHNGHWSVVPALVWMTWRELFGFASYTPYLALAIIAHLTLAHLLWRLLIRTGSRPWIATFLITVFALLGTVPENLTWGFQVGFMGSIALAVGALLIALRPSIGPWGLVAVSFLLLLAAMTAGTGLPFFLPVAVVLLRAHGWRSLLWALLLPVVSYAGWFLLLAGPNSASIYRASGVDDFLRGIPLFMARMFVDGYTITTGVPSFGLLIIGAIAAYVIVVVGRRGVSLTTLTILAMLAAGILFSLLTAYSRLHAGEGDGRAPRYVYVIIVATLPAIGALLSYAVGLSVRRLLAVGALIGFVSVYNVGALVNGAHANADRAKITQQAVSAALALSDTYGMAIDSDAWPLAVVHRSVAELASLERDYGLARVPYDSWAELTALANVGLTLEPEDAPDSCVDDLQPGEMLSVGVDGLVLSVPGDTAAHLTVVATEGGSRSDPRTLTLAPGSHLLSSVKDVTLEVQDPANTAAASSLPSMEVRLCGER